VTWCNSAIITSYWLGAEGHARPEQQSSTEKCPLCSEPTKHVYPGRILIRNDAVASHYQRTLLHMCTHCGDVAICSRSTCQLGPDASEAPDMIFHWKAHFFDCFKVNMCKRSEHISASFGTCIWDPIYQGKNISNFQAGCKATPMLQSRQLHQLPCICRMYSYMKMSYFRQHMVMVLYITGLFGHLRH